MSKDDKGVAIVTGASQGIGRAIALRLADDGFDVAINDLDGSAAKDNLETLRQEIIAKGRQSLICTGDVSVEADVVNLVDEAVKGLGDITVVSLLALHESALGLINTA